MSSGTNGYFIPTGPSKIRQQPITEKFSAVTNKNLADVVTYTAAEILTGLITRDCNGGNRTDIVPTAAALVAAIPGVEVGDVIKCYMINTTAGANTITLGGAPAGITYVNAGQTLSQNESALLLFRFTNVTAAAEAVTVYLIGS